MLQLEEKLELPLLFESSFFPLLKGMKNIKRKDIFWHYPHYGNQGGTPGSSIRSGDYKLIKFYEDNNVELYNLRTDISENFDISENESSIREDLEERLELWLKKAGAILPIMNSEYENGKKLSK